MRLPRPLVCFKLEDSTERQGEGCRQTDGRTGGEATGQTRSHYAPLRYSQSQKISSCVWPPQMQIRAWLQSRGLGRRCPGIVLHHQTQKLDTLLLSLKIKLRDCGPGPETS